MMLRFKIVRVTAIIASWISLYAAYSQNPIIRNMGVNDPHIRIFNNKAYLYASHDKSIDNKTFVMEDWMVWSSADLVNWKLESVLKPEDTYIGKPFTGCWATDAAYRNGKYYFYFSETDQRTGVVVGDSPVGPWKDVLRKPLLTPEMTATREYDVAIIEDKGHHYIVFGLWDYYIARLNDDMISLAEEPRKIVIHNPEGPYGKGRTDDKPFLHKYKNRFYLSWGCFYGMSDNVYGPYDYKGSIMSKESFAAGYDKPTWPSGFQQGRHGSFFEWHNQWYFTYCDITQTGNRYFRDSFISYLHYKENGEMSIVRVDGVGVGNYEANNGQIETEDYFKADAIEKKECEDGGFMMQTTATKSLLGFPNIKGLSGKKAISFRTVNTTAAFTIEIRRNSPTGKLLKRCRFKKQTQSNTVTDHRFDLSYLEEKESLFLIVKQKGNKTINLTSFSFQ